MNWEEMTPGELRKAVTACKGVCVVPMGCFESHGEHMPVGADCFQVDEMVRRAAQIESILLEFGSCSTADLHRLAHAPGASGIP